MHLNKNLKLSQKWKNFVSDLEKLDREQLLDKVLELLEILHENQEALQVSDDDTEELLIMSEFLTEFDQDNKEMISPDDLNV